MAEGLAAVIQAARPQRIAIPNARNESEELMQHTGVDPVVQFYGGGGTDEKVSPNYSDYLREVAVPRQDDSLEVLYEAFIERHSPDKEHA